jgi:hypothetical protein
MFLIQLIVPQSAKCFYRKMVEHCTLTHSSHTHHEGGTGTPKDRDEVNWREIYECDGECVIWKLQTPHQYFSWYVIQLIVLTSLTVDPIHLFRFRFVSWSDLLPKLGRRSRHELVRVDSPWQILFPTLVRDDSPSCLIFVSYESINREIQIQPTYECRCDGRQKNPPVHPKNGDTPTRSSPRRWHTHEWGVTGCRIVYVIHAFLVKKEWEKKWER